MSSSVPSSIPSIHNNLFPILFNPTLFVRPIHPLPFSVNVSSSIAIVLYQFRSSFSPVLQFRCVRPVGFNPCTNHRSSVDTTVLYSVQYAISHSCIHTQCRCAQAFRNHHQFHLCRTHPTHFVLLFVCPPQYKVKKLFNRFPKHKAWSKIRSE